MTRLWLSPDMSDQPGRKDFLLQEGQTPLQEPCLLPRVSLPASPCPAEGVTVSGVSPPDFWVGLAKVTPTPTPGPSLGFPGPCLTPFISLTPSTTIAHGAGHTAPVHISATINLYPVVCCVRFLPLHEE